MPAPVPLPPFAMTSPNDPLDPLLDRWGDPPAQPPLATEVWRRLATHRAPPSAAAPGPLAWWRLLDLTFARASFATAFVVACVLLGLFLAEVRVSHLRNARDHQLAQTYLRLIDPLLVESTRTPPAPGGS